MGNIFGAIRDDEDEISDFKERYRSMPVDKAWDWFKRAPWYACDNHGRDEALTYFALHLEDARKLRDNESHFERRKALLKGYETRLLGGAPFSTGDAELDSFADLQRATIGSLLDERNKLIEKVLAKKK